MTNLTSLDVAGGWLSKDIFKMIDKLLNDTATHLKKSSKVKCELAVIEKKLCDT